MVRNANGNHRKQNGIETLPWSPEDFGADGLALLPADCNLRLAAFQRGFAYLESGRCPVARDPAIRKGAVNLMNAGLRQAAREVYARSDLSGGCKVRTCLILMLACAAAAETPSTWRLSTGDTAVVLGIEQDRPVLRSLGSAGAQRNWLAAPVVEALMPVVELDGSSVKTNWKFQGAALDPKKEQLTLRFTNTNPQLTLLSIWRARPGHGPVEHWLEIAFRSGVRGRVTAPSSTGWKSQTNPAARSQ